MPLPCPFGLQTLQGAVLASSDRGGIRVQYSKNPFGAPLQPLHQPLRYA